MKTKMAFIVGILKRKFCRVVCMPGIKEEKLLMQQKED